MYIIGLTGGISCGKSSVAESLRRYCRAVTLDIDTVTHWLSEPGGELFEIYVRHFGERIITDKGFLDKKLIGEIIFNNPDERKWINSVAHPILLNHARDFLVESCEAGAGLVVLEVPLLFEAGWEHLFDEIWAVYTKRQLQIKRLMSRDRLTREEALARINAQMTREEICSRADVVIRNVKGYADVRRQISEALRGRKF
ncbi:MAG: dephospho-CoA kinase [Selenomonadaceae bacterium]|nr:dephospho-CoA kinase [Selenomonadaceae bacterium]